MSKPILSIENLFVEFDTPDGAVNAVNNISCQLSPGECLGIVGESGSGKSQTFLAVMGLLARNATVNGAIDFKEQSLLSMTRQERSHLLGDRMSMIFQDPLTSLTPHMRIGDQMQEVLSVHQKMKSADSRLLCLDWLDRVRISDAKHRLRQYPHELSGGMRQRVMIAMAMLCKPDILIADEPSTALDVTVQADILDLMTEFRTELETAIVLITHDMGVVARMCNRIAVMQSGEFVEQGSANDIFYTPNHEYTRMLLAAVPRLDAIKTVGKEMQQNNTETELLRADNVVAEYKLPGKWLQAAKTLHAVNGVSFSLNEGETLGIVGESGSGKSTLARSLIRLKDVSQGRVVWLGKNIHTLDAKELRATRADMQMVFQDPLASLDPARTIGYSIMEPLGVHESTLTTSEKKNRVAQAMTQVGLDSGLINRYPHELSGGQNQRVGIARAMIVNPKMLICDEAVSALDVSIQAQILKLLVELQKETAVSIVFISHDLSVISNLADRVLVMHRGSVVEFASTQALFSDPRHPYTKQLISAVPIPDPEVEAQRSRIQFRDDTPVALDSTSTLQFLPSKHEIDPTYKPKLLSVSPHHWVAEHDPLEALLIGI